MKIASVDVFQVDIPYVKPFVIAGGPSRVASHVAVRIGTDEGVTGVGEAAPMPSYSEETQGDIVNALAALAPLLIGEDPFAIGSIHRAMDRAVFGHQFAKAAIDLALHDLMGKALGLPVYQLLGGKMRDKVPLAWAVGLASIDEMVREAVEYRRRGFSVIKLKVGNDPQKDLEMVRAVREALGPDVPIRVDANQGYGVDVAIKTFRKMERYELELIEQPVARWDLKGMAKVAAALDTPVMADESMFGIHDAINLIRHEAADIVNLKIMKPGGLYRSRQVAAVCEAAGVPCMVGSMIEMGIGTAAGMHFAAASAPVTYASELIGPVMLKGDLIREDHFSPDKVAGFLVPSDAPGLGVTLLDPDAHGEISYVRWEERRVVDGSA